jgi:hypothetical protein
MTFITKKHLPRRTFLRGLGVTLALPLLDSMVPAQTPLGKTAASPRTRMGFIYVPHGAIMSSWTPIGQGTAFEFSPILTPLERFRERLLVVSGLNQKNAVIPHGICPPTWLSGAAPKPTEGVDVRAGTSCDQIAAQKIGQDTRFPSLELATEDLSGVYGACERPYSCVYMNTLSWSTPTTPLPMEINPRVVFERLFGQGDTEAVRLARLAEDRSILDSVRTEASHLELRLGSHDRTTVNDYLENVREIERQIQGIAKQHASSEMALPDAPVGVPESYEEHVRLLFELLTLAYRADITRVFTFMLAREVSQRTYPQIGVPEPHHSLSHHQNNPEKIAKLAKLQNYHISLFSRFLERLQSIQDGDGNLLDHSLLLYGSNMSNSNVHDHSELPLIVAGGGAGRLQGGRHLKFPDRTPMSNLLLNLLDKAGVPIESIGDSTGRLAEV